MSTAALPVHVALVDETKTIDHGLLASVAGALSEQIASDFAPVWKVAASVGVYPHGHVPPGCWAIHIQQHLDDPGALGYHTDAHNQPVSYVLKDEGWPQTTSHELLEMLADPWGNRMHGARVPQGLEERYADFGLHHAKSHVQYLLEVCDPCELQPYNVGGHDLSDFLLPAWYRTNPGHLPNTSHAGGCWVPRQVSDGGYVSFMNPVTDEWFQAFAQGSDLKVSDLGKFDDSRGETNSLREWTDEWARANREAMAHPDVEPPDAGPAAS